MRGGCDAETLADIEQLRLVFDHIIRDLELHVSATFPGINFPHPEE